MIPKNEIDRGLVLHLDPDELEACGATYTCLGEFRVRGRHFFLCVGANDDCGLWVPMYTNAGVERKELNSAGRSGHPKWTQGRFHYHPAQLWSATHNAVLRAAHASGDLSAPQNRNRLTEECVSVVAESIPEYVD